MNSKYLVSFFLRTGLGIVFLYAGVSCLIYPDIWVSFIPSFIYSVFTEKIFLTIYSIFQIILALWLFSGYKPYAASILTALTLILIIVFNIQSLDLIFRDIAILFAALALMFLSKEK